MYWGGTDIEIIPRYQCVLGCFPNFLYVPELLAYFLGVKGSMDETGESVAIGFYFVIVPQYIEGRRGRMWKSRRCM